MEEASTLPWNIEVHYLNCRIFEMRAKKKNQAIVLLIIVSPESKHYYMDLGVKVYHERVLPSILRFGQI